MHAVILAGGKGTRLHPYTVTFPKPLMPLDDMPIIEIVLRRLKRFGIERVTMAVGHLAELMIAFLGDGERFGLQIDYSREAEPRGTAGPLGIIPDLPETFLVMNGDLLTTLDFSRLLAKHRERNHDLTIACHKRQTKVDFGVIETNSQDIVQAYVEKPSYDYDVSMGVYVFNRVALDYIPRDKHLDLPDLIRAMMPKHKVGAYFHKGFWLDIGQHGDYDDAQRIFSEKRDLFLSGNEEPTDHP